MPQSETSTIAIPEDAHATSDAHHKPKEQPHITLPPGVDHTHGQNLTLTRTRTHDSHNETRPDLSFPFGTTDLNRGGFTNEYRAVSESGYMPADLALRPVPSRIYRLPQALSDPEKVRELKQMKLVTWKEDDPEEEERQRRAAIAARMAKLGGARVGMGPPVFGRKPDVPKKPEVRKEEETKLEQSGTLRFRLGDVCVY